MKIDPMQIPGFRNQHAGPTTTLLENISNSFSSMLAEVNQAQIEADRKIEEFATSPNKDLHGTMIAMEKAGISLRLLLQIRSKLTNAYHEITRMQI